MMAQEIFVSIDAGTSVIKSVAFDADGNLLASTAEANRYRKTADGGFEQDMTATWEKTAATVAAVLRRIPDAGRRVAALAVTGQGDGAWLVDRDNAPLGDAMLWLDTRAADIVDALNANGARAAAYRFTGTALSACNQSAQLAYLKREQPQRLRRADCALHCKDWLYLNLTGVRATDPSEGVFTFGDFRSGEYADEVLEAFDLTDCRRLLPPIVDGSRRTEPLTAAAAKLTGLKTGTPVSLGGVDVVCAALGGGVRPPGDAFGCSVIGTTGMHIKMETGVKNLELGDVVSGYTMLVPGAPGAAMRMQSNMSATLNLDWFAGLLAEAAAMFSAKGEGAEGSGGAAESLQRLDAAAAGAPPGDALFLPYIESGERGPFLNADARAQFSGLHSGIGIGALVRAVYDGVALAARHCYQALGGAPREVRPVGGGARSRALCDIFAHALNARVSPAPGPEPGALGAGLLAAVAVGRFADLGEACRAWVEPHFDAAPGHAPDAALCAHYDRLFDAYLAAVDAAAPVWAKLAAVRRAGRTNAGDAGGGDAS